MDIRTVEVDGIKFRCYLKSKKAPLRRYYRPHAGWIRQGIGYLHRYIWQKNFGKIPQGHHVHHKDGDTHNNDISNLECIPASEHYALHGLETSKRINTDEHRKFLEKIRPLTKQWHASEEGLKWHRGNAKHFLKENRVSVAVTCQCCGKIFLADSFRAKAGRTKYCHLNCKMRARRARLREMKK